MFVTSVGITPRCNGCGARRRFECWALRRSRADPLGTMAPMWGGVPGSIHVMSVDVVFGDADSGAEVLSHRADVRAPRSLLVERGFGQLIDRLLCWRARGEGEAEGDAPSGGS
mgnify:CR=1 FL=1